MKFPSRPKLALGPAADGGEWIVTVPRVGYRFTGAIEQLGGAKRKPLPLPDKPSIAVLYVAGITSNTLVWAPGSGPRPGHKPSHRGRRAAPDLISVKDLALALPAKAWRTIRWREGTNDWLSSRFARVRVRVGHRHLTAAPVEEWLLIEWPEGEDAPTKYWLSTLAEDIGAARKFMMQ